MPERSDPKHEYGWCLHTHNGGCGRKIELERRGGHGARIVGKCDGIVRQIDVDYEE